MAASSLGLNPEALFISSAYSCASPFLDDYALSIPVAGATVTSGDGDFLVELEDHHYPFEYSSLTAPSFFTCAGGDDHGEKTIGKRAMVSGRIGFRTRSEVEILDDGFKWRKYGKKAVKNSPNPRNYYRCSVESCGVKKRVERDRDDHRYVVTTYDGVHNHATPGAAALRYYSPPSSASSPPAGYSTGSSLHF